MPVDHIEVAPRMWDKRLAANIIQSNESQEIPSNKTQDVADQALTVGVSFFTRFKNYIIPVAFVLAVLLVIYIVYTYFTKYRNAKLTTEVITEDEISDKKNMLNPAVLIETEDLSKYEYESDVESHTYKEEREMSVIEEEDEEDEEDEDEDGEDEEESNYDETDDVSEDEDDEEPNLSEIETLMQSDEYKDMPILEEDDYGFDIPSFSDINKSKTKRSKKSKPITI